MWARRTPASIPSWRIVRLYPESRRNSWSWTSPMAPTIATAARSRFVGAIAFLDEADVVGDARAVERLGCDRAARDPVRVDVGHDADHRRVPDALGDLLGDRLHRGRLAEDRTLNLWEGPAEGPFPHDAR